MKQNEEKERNKEKQKLLYITGSTNERQRDGKQFDPIFHFYY